MSWRGGGVWTDLETLLVTGPFLGSLHSTVRGLPGRCPRQRAVCGESTWPDHVPQHSLKPVRDPPPEALPQLCPLV